jgi:hypothetical protein
MSSNSSVHVYNLYNILLFHILSCCSLVDLISPSTFYPDLICFVTQNTLKNKEGNNNHLLLTTKIQVFFYIPYQYKIFQDYQNLVITSLVYFLDLIAPLSCNFVRRVLKSLYIPIVAVIVCIHSHTDKFIAILSALISLLTVDWSKSNP